MFAGYAFVYFKDERDARDAIDGLSDKPFGNAGRILTVEWARGRRGRHHGGSGSNQRPTKTLFVINFDPIHTREHDVERHFEHYGKVLNVRIRQNFAFVHFETQDDATKALECTHMSKILDRVISVEYALRDDEGRGGGYDSPRGDYGRRGYGASRRSPSTVYHRSRLSPDRGRSRSSDYDSPSYPRTRSPDRVRYQSRSRVRRSRS